MIGLGNESEATVRRLHTLKRAEQLRADPGWPERVRALDQQTEAVMRKVNRWVGE
jgi:hypothetical protein